MTTESADPRRLRPDAGHVRTGDRSTPAEDDALLRKPRDDAANDPDLERPGEPWQDVQPPAEGEPFEHMRDRQPLRPDRPSDPAEGPDDPDYYNEN